MVIIYLANYYKFLQGPNALHTTLPHQWDGCQKCQRRFCIRSTISEGLKRSHHSQFLESKLQLKQI